MKQHLSALVLLVPAATMLGCGSEENPNAQNWANPPECLEGQQLCGTTCIDPNTNDLNCGTCGTVCTGGRECQAGVCACGGSTTDCNGQCINTVADIYNCGSCGNTCAPGQDCQGGLCTCLAGLTTCGTTCADLNSDGNNCGTCGNVCPVGTVCSQGTCGTECASGTPCGSSCVDLMTSVANCGQCGNICAAGQSCVGGSCTCPAGQMSCNGACVITATDPNNCGSCGVVCTSGQTCVNGACTGGTVAGTGGATTGAGGSGATGATAAGGTVGTGGVTTGTGGVTTGTGGVTTGTGGVTTGTGGVTTGTGGAAGACNPACTGGMECVAGVCQCPAGQIDCDGTCVVGTTCPTTDCPLVTGMVSDFENQSFAILDQPGEDWTGSWEDFTNTDADGAVGTQTFTIEEIGTEACNQYAAHTTGSGWGGWVGIGMVFRGTGEAPVAYDGSAWTGIKFRAKLGAGHAANSPVRFNISTPWTEGTGSGGTCVDQAADAQKSARPCYQHVGRFLANEYALTTEWQELSFCFDRDLYPLSLPSNLTNEQRDSIATNILKIQFQFNQAKDWSLASYPAEGDYPELDKTLAFDFWVDDLQLFTGECPTDNFASSAGTAAPFPQNSNIGSCAPATGAARFNTAISQAYERWKTNFVRDGQRVIAPEQENGVTTSEAMGYGMLIAAAMGDQATFDGFWSYVQANLEGTGLMNWKPSGGSGSATDGDNDIAYALLMADAQWGGYASAASAMISAILANDVDGSFLKPGSGWSDRFNPSYFAPSYYRVFSGFDSVISGSYTLLNNNISATTAGFPSNWADPQSGNPTDAGSAAVTSDLVEPVYGYDAARVPWRIGLDVCSGGTEGSSAVNSIVSYFAPRYDDGATIDLLKAGWDKNTGGVAPEARPMQGSFIGPMGIAGMAVGNTAMRDRAFRTMLDILENGDFNHTYFPSTVGFITMLIMSGNFPMP